MSQQEKKRKHINSFQSLNDVIHWSPSTINVPSGKKRKHINSFQSLNDAIHWSPSTIGGEQVVDACLGTPIDADLREQILKMGPYQPEGNFQKDAKGGSFSLSYYSFISKAGQKIERKWLCYSTRLHVVYCQAGKTERKRRTKEKERARKRRGLVVLGSGEENSGIFWSVKLTRNPERE
ncbi:hypothetical protein TNCV_892841 [Trichonephila clavipes]|nr:hypothetical protein TNCV_892841 [Trichonephila clavipes]